MKEIGENAARQLDLLSKYYDIDYETRTITITLSYDKASDILDAELSKKESPVINMDVLDKISKVIKTFPAHFKARIDLVIKDYEGYDADVLMSSITDSLQLFHNLYNNSKVKSWIQAAILIFVGVIVLFAMFATGRYNWVSNEVLQSLLAEANTVVGWVFVWQAVTVLFLEDSSLGDINKNLLGKISTISLKDSDGKAVTHLRSEEYMKQWFTESYRVKVSKVVMLIVGTALLTIAPIHLTLFIEEFCKAGIFTVETISRLVVSSLTAALFVLGGVGALSLVYGQGLFKKIVAVCSIALLAISPVALFLGVLAFVNSNPQFGLLFIIIFVASIAFFCAWIVNYKADLKFKKISKI